MGVVEGADFGEKIGEAQLLWAEMAVDVNEFVCKICCVHVVGSNPMLTACSHLFCGDCLQQRLTQESRGHPSDAVPCPACEAPIRPNLDVCSLKGGGSASCGVLWRVLQSLKVKCTSPCCHWTGDYGTYTQHRRSGTCSGTLPAEQAAEEELPSDIVVTPPGLFGDELEPPPCLAHVKTSPPSTPSLCSGAPSLTELSEDTSESADVLGDAEATTPSSATSGQLLSLIQSLVNLETVTSPPSSSATLAEPSTTTKLPKQDPHFQTQPQDVKRKGHRGKVARKFKEKAERANVLDAAVGRDGALSLSVALGDDNAGGARSAAPAAPQLWQDAFRWQTAMRAAQLQMASRAYANQMAQYQAAHAMWATAAVRQFQDPLASQTC